METVIALRLILVVRVLCLVILGVAVIVDFRKRR